MKKAILIILVLTMTTLALAGCISVLPHKLFSDPWESNEVATYEATRSIHDKNTSKDDDKKITGTTTMTTTRHNNEEITVGTAVIKNFTGTTVNVDTLFTDGSLMKSCVAFKPTFEPVASYKYINVVGYENTDPSKDIEQTYQLEYSYKKAVYTQTVDSVQSTGEIKLGKWNKDPYYDNLMVYHVARSSYKYKDDSLLYNNISLDVISTSNMELKTLTTAKQGVTPVYLGDDKPTETPEGETPKEMLLCDVVAISLVQDITGSGKPLEAYYNNVKLKEDYQGINFKSDRRLVKFKEGSITYVLKSLAETK